jgi:hypothetical protein
MSTIIKHKKYVESSRVPTSRAMPQQSSGTSPIQSRVFSTAPIFSGDLAKRLEEAQIKVKAAYAKHQEDLAEIEEYRKDGTSIGYVVMCMTRDADKDFNNAIKAIQTEYADSGFQPEMPSS